MNRKTSMIKRSYSSSPIEFPTSPQEITHYSHSKHPLSEITMPEIFTCSGCKEYGAGKRFSCRQCDFQLHDFCTFLAPILKNHPLHAQHQLVFHSKPRSAKSGISWPRCDVCGKSAKGFTFQCGACGFQMHPCCSMLSTEINLTIHPHHLHLQPATNGGVHCMECGKRRPGRAYSCSTCESYHLHAACAKSLFNGLKDNGIPTPERPSALGTAARVASQVVIKFIGGLLEGIGEGVADALVQNMVRGRNRRQLD